jgi:HK97 family phage portal protein
VFRAVQILSTAASQLSIDAYRAGVPVEDQALTHQPDPRISRAAWVEETVINLATKGEAFWKPIRNTVGQTIALEVIENRRVSVWRSAPGLPARYASDGVDQALTHLKLMRIPGELHGLGPIQAARADINGALDVRDYGAGFFDRASVPAGVLSTDQDLSPEQLTQWRDAWKETADPDLRILANGLEYAPMRLNPADAQWLESRAFSTLEIARLFGISTSLMLISPDGDSQTYANVEQDWIAFTRFTLMAYLTEIETALTAHLPRGQKARFNIEALLRTDTATRYESYATAIDKGFLTVNEVRELEGREPLPEQTSEQETNK